MKGCGVSVKVAVKAAVKFLLSPEARRYESILVVGVYAAIKAALNV